MNTLLAISVASTLSSGQIWSHEGQPAQVIELFTSEGCSSCPPADKYLSTFEESERLWKEIIPVAYHVDYWDYLGWKDTLGSPAHSKRQRAYAARRGDRSVYTPQIVVNGNEHVVGSNKAAVEAAFKRADAFTADVSLKVNDMAIEATVEGDLPDGTHMATVYFLRVKDRETVAIGRGENAGATVSYVNVVRSLQPIGMWSGGTATFRMPKSELMRSKDNRCAVLIQLENSEGPGRIIGAAIMNWDAKG